LALVTIDKEIENSIL